MGRRPRDHGDAAGHKAVKALFVTRNRDAAALARTLGRLAPSDLPVLLEGETGVGKSFVAVRIHRAGRRGRPLVVAGGPLSLIAPGRAWALELKVLTSAQGAKLLGVTRTGERAAF